jgi:lysozyme
MIHWLLMLFAPMFADIRDVCTPTEWREIISSSEGLSLKAYWDATGKVWTIGKGNTIVNGIAVKEGDTITQFQADLFMIQHVNRKVIPTLKRTIPEWDKMNASQHAALISFAYNLGENFYGRKGFESITRDLCSRESWKNVPATLGKYVKSGGRVLPGLVKRREKEGLLFKQGMVY